MNHKWIGHFVRDLRVGKGLTQDKLAEQIGCSSRFISAIERGVTRLPSRCVRRFADAVEIDPAVVVHRMTENERENILREMGGFI